MAAAQRRDRRTNEASLLQRGASVAVLVVALRIGLANLAPISDCDEVYNYWEPVHFLRFGTGMQTWEYAPQYALRTYAYLVPVAMISKAYDLLLSVLPTPLLSLLGRTLSQTVTTGIKPLQFNMVRATLAAMMALSELNLHKAISDKISPSVANWFLIASVSSAGMFHAAPAYLPSSHVMSCWMCSAAAQIRGNDAEAIVLGLVAVLGFGWPFSAVLFVTTGVWAVMKAAGFVGMSRSSKIEAKRNGAKSSSSLDVAAIIKLLLRTALHAAVIQSVVMAIDYVHYGKIVSPTLNIFIYNTKGQGDELYGIEPLSYYIKNIFLNLNFVSVLGIVALPVVGVKALVQNRQANDSTFSAKMLLLLPMYIWLAIVAPRPHKEERFLFPIYPMLCVGAALVVDEVALFASELVERFAPSSPWNTQKMKQGITIAALIPIVLISVSRSAALVANYSSPLKAYSRLHEHMTTVRDGPITVCVGGEWYRYPSSFQLPPYANLAFIKSSFGGQLPQPFTEFGSKEQSLSLQKGKFNDMNQEEMDRYVDIQSCAYVVELVHEVGKVSSSGEGHIPEGLQYMKKAGIKNWREVARYPYLDVDETSSLHRILYLPFIRQGRVAYKDYTIYEHLR